ncbi:MAG: chloride channel protein [Atopobiaceae bacterium]|jgi:H+/Cl- antiporter ClcA|nr:chloride channel protein [Atopobiaceae bacterium]MCH4180184.1 chloride channel protein [Atopobiaceae bacterium]MCH4214354.1 chloride channel protein [Atopobiaceae bacterium]MCH4229215.1 chloride channel protein [Atopobiaceae bacterium]MCH4276586.1 chloride channel protein [Atopobiaceae bacterium]
MSDRKHRGTDEKGDQAEDPRLVLDGAELKGRTRADASAGVIALSLVAGFLVGLGTWAALWLSNFLTEGFWDLVPALLPWWWAPLVICPLGGLVIGLLLRRFHNPPTPMEDVMAEVRRTGGYHVHDLPSALATFAAPLVFGGSIGPEAGLTGLIAAGCTWIGDRLKRAGLAVRDLGEITLSATLSAIFSTPFFPMASAAEEDDATPDPSGYRYPRRTKIILYTAAAFGAFGGVMVVNDVLGSSMSLPRFGATSFDLSYLIWFCPLALVGWLAGCVYNTFDVSLADLSARVGERPIPKAVGCGVLMGLVGSLLPYTMFAGEAQGTEIMGTWQGLGAFVLIATGVMKLFANNLCIHFGWMGGRFFPTIFAGIALGYGMASITGVDPVFCVTVVTTSLVAAMTRKPLLAIGVLILCFPVRSIVWLVLAGLAGAYLPMPAVIDPRKRTAKDAPEKGAAR